MTNERKIDLLISKSQVYKFNFIKSTELGDTEEAAKWKKGYQAIKAEINELKDN